MQVLLARWLDEVRVHRLGNDEGRWWSSLAGILGGLDGLHIAGALTDREHLDWRGRALAAAGDPLLPPNWPVGTGPVSGMPPRATAAPLDQDPPEPAHFVRTIAGPPGTVPVRWGMLAMPALEVYTVRLCFHWHVALLEGEAAFGADWAAAERDLEGLQPTATRALRALRRSRMAFAVMGELWRRAAIEDDAGTSYGLGPTSSLGSLGQREFTGRFSVVPAPPPEASSVSVAVTGGSFAFRLGP